MTTSKNYNSDPLTTNVDMSSDAVTARLKQVSQLRRLCLSLGRTQLEVREAKDSDKRTVETEPNDSIQ